MIGLVVGGAECWRDDVARLEDMVGGRWPGPVFACNDVGTDLPDLDHWCTLHSEKIVQWERERAENGLPMLYETWSCSKRTKIDHHWDDWTGGSSGLYVTAVALFRVGVPKVVLCGIPMDRRPNAYRPGKEWKAYERYLKGWRDGMSQLRGRVRSMSGSTREWFGPPDEEWLALIRRDG